MSKPQLNLTSILGWVWHVYHFAHRTPPTHRNPLSTRMILGVWNFVGDNPPPRVNFFGTKILLRQPTIIQHNFNPTIFWERGGGSQTLPLGLSLPNFFSSKDLERKFFWPNFFCTKIFLTKKFFLTEIFYWSEKFSAQN